MFDAVATPEDLEAVILLEGWTNDRLSSQLGALHHMDRDEWVLGEQGASFVMAAFCHPAPEGGRFNGPEVGAWYCTPEIPTAIAETVHHHTRRLAAADGLFTARVQMRELLSELDAEFDDIRVLRRSDLYARSSYVRSQRFGEVRRKAGSNGIIYDSVRRKGGVCLCVYRPKLIPPVTQGDHYEYVWSGAPDPEVLRLTRVDQD